MGLRGPKPQYGPWLPPKPTGRPPGSRTKPKPIPVDSGWQVYGFDERSGRRYRLEKRTVTCAGKPVNSWVRRVEIGRL